MATPNLGLTTFDTASGSATTFLQFRLALADASSNMSKIDDWVGGASASIVNLGAGVIKNVVGNLASPNYFVGTSDLESYEVGGFINVILDADVAGDTQININSIGNTYLKKIDTSGSVVALVSGDMTKNSYYLLTYDGTQYILMSGGTGGTSGSGISSISGSSIMSDTTGSVVKHNLSGVTSGSYDRVSVDNWGHITSASVVSYSTIWAADAKPASPHAIDDEFDDSSLGVSWNLFNPGSAVLISEDDRGLMLYSGSVFGTICGIYKDAPSSSFTIWTKMSVETNAIDDYKSGILLSDDIETNPTTASLIIVSLSGEFLSMNTQVEAWSNYQTYGTGIANDGLTTLPVAGPSMYVRVRVTYNVLSVDLSNDGVGWFRYVDDVTLPFYPIAHIGLFNRAVDRDDNRTHFSFFRCTELTDTNQTMYGRRIKLFPK